MRLVNSAQRLPGDGPIVVHCSAGIGRSGTFCAVHSIVQHMHQHVADHGEIPPINLVETVLALRDQRPGMVQTKVRAPSCASELTSLTG
jgi:protein tyrosine phosphatase